MIEIMAPIFSLLCTAKSLTTDTLWFQIQSRLRTVLNSDRAAGFGLALPWKILNLVVIQHNIVFSSDSF